jgi:bifunctional non-homologous end joining protein LigD
VAGVALTHPERVLWQEGITKRDLALFYEEIADWLLPHITGRPLSLVRCPSGAEAKCFFQKHAWAGLGDDIRRMTVREENGDEEEILFVDDIRGVISLVQASVLEIHPWGSAVADIEKPDRIIMDLDPGPGVAWADVVAAAFDVRERLRGVKLESFVKTTGGKGLHVVVPLKPKAGWTEVKAFAQALALAMEADAPDRYLAKASKQARRGLIYVDYLRNGRGATAVAAFSTRARPGAPVSVPVDWAELTAGLRPDGLTLRDLPARLSGLARGPWHDLERSSRPLPAAVSKQTGRVRNRRT